MALVAIVIFAWIATLDGDWLKAQLIKKAVSAGAALTIEQCTFAPFRGEASVISATLRHNASKSDSFTSETRTISVDLQNAEVDVLILPLLSRRVEIDRLEVHQPTIVAHLTREEFTTSAKVMNRNRILDAARSAAWEGVTGNIPGIREDDISKRKRWFWIRGDRILLASDLIVSSGTLEYRMQKQSLEPFEAKVLVSNYHARNVALDSPYELANRADYEATIDLSGTGATLQRAAYADPSVWRASGLDLAYLDGLFDQSDALRYEAGTLELESRSNAGPPGGYTLDLTLKGVKLGHDPESDKQTEFMVPVETLVALVNARSGDIRLSLNLAKEFELSSDLDVLSREIGKALWTTFAKVEAPQTQSTGELVERAAQRFGKEITTGSVQKLFRVRNREQN